VSLQQIARVPPPRVADERTMLEAWLDWHRATLLIKCAGLSAAQLKQRSVAPSSLSLLGLVRHMTEVERSWFRRRLAGERDDQAGPLYYTDERPDADFDDVEEADAAAMFEAYQREVERCRAVAAGVSLDLVVGEGYSVRWIYVHLLEEYARHNGHADLLRERIDGATGA